MFVALFARLPRALLPCRISFAAVRSGVKGRRHVARSSRLSVVRASRPSPAQRFRTTGSQPLVARAAVIILEVRVSIARGSKRAARTAAQLANSRESWHPAVRPLNGLTQRKGYAIDHGAAECWGQGKGELMMVDSLAPW